MSIITTDIDWVKTVSIDAFPKDGGACVKVKGKQIAVFNFKGKDEWFATDNLCPHKKEMALARGIIGDKQGEPKVACPFHKRQFSLKSGACLDDPSCGNINTYPVKIENGDVYIQV